MDDVVLGPHQTLEFKDPLARYDNLAPAGNRRFDRNHIPGETVAVGGANAELSPIDHELSSDQVIADVIDSHCEAGSVNHALEHPLADLEGPIKIGCRLKTWIVISGKAGQFVRPVRTSQDQIVLVIELERDIFRRRHRLEYVQQFLALDGGGQATCEITNPLGGQDFDFEVTSDGRDSTILLRLDQHIAKNWNCAASSNDATDRLQQAIESGLRAVEFEFHV